MKKKSTKRAKVAVPAVLESVAQPPAINITIAQTFDARGAAEGLIDQLPGILQAANENLRAELVERLRTASIAKVVPPKSAVAVRFCKVASDGRALPASASDWEGVYDATTGLIWGRRLLAGERNWKDAVKAAGEATLCGAPARAPTIQERLSIVDYQRVEPALDVTFFDPKETSAWEWTSTPAASPSDYAWFVNLSGGYSYRYLQSSAYHVRAVRAGQPIGL